MYSQLRCKRTSKGDWPRMQRKSQKQQYRGKLAGFLDKALPINQSIVKETGSGRCRAEGGRKKRELAL